MSTDTQTSTAKFTVGQMVHRLTARQGRVTNPDDRYRWTTETISRVGRKYVYIQAGFNEQKFNAQNGFEPVSYGNGARIFDDEGKARWEREQAAHKGLRRHRVIELSYGDMYRLETLEAVVALLDADVPTAPEA